MPPSALLQLAPHSTDAERTVIGALLLDPEAIYQIDDKLKPRDFFDPVYRDIFAAVQGLSRKGTAVDFITVADALRESDAIARSGGAAFLMSLAEDVPTASHVRHYAEIVLEKSRRRQLGEIGRKIASLAQADQKDADELTELAQREFLTLAGQGAESGPTLLATIGSQQYDYYAKLCESDEVTLLGGVRTGFSDLDEKLTSLAPGQLVILAGRPGMGKTAMALDIARHVAFDEGKVVAFISLEMTKEEVFNRLFAASLGVAAWKLSKGGLTDEQFGAMGPVLDEFAKHPLYIDDDANSSLVHICSKARRQQMQHGLDLLIVDYLQLIEVTDRAASENQNQRITYISKSLKRLARELHIPVLALSQLSRECDRRPDKRPQLSDLRDSGSLEQDGDRILMLYRESEYEEDCGEPDATDLFIRKNRHGPRGTVRLRFNHERMTFSSHDKR